MTLVAGTGVIFYFPNVTSVANPALQSFSLDSATESVSAILSSGSAGILSSIGVRISTVVSSATVEIRVESVDTSNGAASGNLFSTAATGTLILGNTDDNVYKIVDLSSGVVLKQNDLLAVKFYLTGTGDLNIHLGQQYSPVAQNSYISTILGGTTDKTLVGINLALLYSDSASPQVSGVYPFQDVGATTRTRNSTNAEIGNDIIFPYPVTVKGYWANISHVSSNNSASEFRLYGSDTETVLAYESLSANIIFDSNRRYVEGFFNTEISLSANTIYKITHLAVGESSCQTSILSTTTQTFMQSMPGGRGCVYTQRATTGAWVSSNTSMACVGILASRFDDGTAVGGGGSNNVKITIGASQRAQI